MPLASDHHDQSGRSKRPVAANTSAPRLTSSSPAPSPRSTSVNRKGNQTLATASRGLDDTRNEATPTPPSPIESRTTRAENTTTKALTPPHPHMEHLLSSLESALAAAVIMQDTNPTTTIYSDRILHIMAALSRRITPPLGDACSPCTQIPTKASPTPLQTSHLSLDCPGQGRTTSSASPEARSPAPAPDKPPPPMIPAPVPIMPSTPHKDHTRDHIHGKSRTSPSRVASVIPSNRFTVRWPDAVGPVKLKLSHEQLLAKLNTHCPGRSVISECRFGGLSWTPNNSLAVFTCAPYTAQHAYSEAKDIIESLVSSASNTPAKALMSLDTPWHGAVIHDVFAQKIHVAHDARRFAAFLREVLHTDVGIRTTHLKDVRYLCAKGDATSVEHCSIRLMFDDYDAATRLVRQGINIEGQHFRASVYRPKPRSAKVTA
ncbi:hypothetical protein BD626DRAFT_629890 [Schizophyllum amplum]|uniref:Uncharacterized protein n=1 Tax=Schizophyllum amplum TaxID=97359 RepID=A0A550CH84_9AGAR|nr:hypothetical protein BD626DRAFT_629890 [Auriculariopsis ampla]